MKTTALLVLFASFCIVQGMEYHPKEGRIHAGDENFDKRELMEEDLSLLKNVKIVQLDNEGEAIHLSFHLHDHDEPQEVKLYRAKSHINEKSKVVIMGGDGEIQSETSLNWRDVHDYTDSLTAHNQKHHVSVVNGDYKNPTLRGVMELGGHFYHVQPASGHGEILSGDLLRQNPTLSVAIKEQTLVRSVSEDFCAHHDPTTVENVSVATREERHHRSLTPNRKRLVVSAPADNPIAESSTAFSPNFPSGCPSTPKSFALDTVTDGLLFANKQASEGGNDAAVTAAIISEVSAMTAWLSDVYGRTSNVYMTVGTIMVLTELGSQGAGWKAGALTWNGAVCDEGDRSAQLGLLLDSFGCWANDQSTLSGGLTQMLTGCYETGAGTVGKGWIGVVCQDSSFTFSSPLRCAHKVSVTAFRPSVFLIAAHELGHNFGINHDSNNVGIMAPSGNGITEFSLASQTELCDNYAGNGGQCATDHSINCGCDAAFDCGFVCGAPCDDAQLGLCADTSMVCENNVCVAGCVLNTGCDAARICGDDDCGNVDQCGVCADGSFCSGGIECVVPTAGTPFETIVNAERAFHNVGSNAAWDATLEQCLRAQGTGACASIGGCGSTTFTTTWGSSVNKNDEAAISDHLNYLSGQFRDTFDCATNQFGSSSSDTFFERHYRKMIDQFANVRFACYVERGCTGSSAFHFGVVCTFAPSYDTDPAVNCAAASCAAQSCAEQGILCGVHNDTCGSPLDCDTPGCATGLCVGTSCCNPDTCLSLGFECGSVPEAQRCEQSGDEDCSSCDDGFSCISNQCIEDCVPETCASRGWACGTVPSSARCGQDAETCSCTGDDECVDNTCCTPFTCDSLGWGCGEVPSDQRCGLPADVCTGCGDTGVCFESNHQCCFPETCDSLGRDCGVLLDAERCGQGDVPCPGCTAPGEICDGAFQCICPHTCDSQNVECGSLTTECNTLDCPNTCGENDECLDSNTCCTPSTCESENFACGTIASSQLCGLAALNCNDCGSGETCVDITNGRVCECVHTCDSLHVECGDFTSECNELSCDSCADGLVCQNNVCCTPDTCDSLGFQCGNVPASQSCGLGAQACGGCGSGEVCTNNQCVCSPAECSDNECESIPDGCNGFNDCGDCDAGFDCFESTCCAPATCADDAFECGTIPSALTCGSSTNCGTCSGANAQCSNNLCTCSPDTCDSLSIECGSVADDGCGNALDCGGCSQDGVAGVCESDGTCCFQDTCESLDWECGVIPSSQRCFEGPFTCSCVGDNQECNEHVCEAACVPDTCFGLGFECGTIPSADVCDAGDLSCGTCGNGQVCLDNNKCCTPTSCDNLECGEISAAAACADAPVQCGVCGDDETCQNNACVCVPSTCAAVGATCGTVDTGCGDVTCGSCDGSDACVDNTCCEAASCGSSEFQCGVIAASQNCGVSNVDCGECAAGESCVNHQCGCVHTCETTGIECGSIETECNTVSGCGTCDDNEVCNENVCCAPDTCEALGYECGSLSSAENCDQGATSCPTTCEAGFVCIDHACECNPITACLDNQCGTVSNGCGGNLECPSCADGSTCLAEENQCCTPAASCSANSCGTLPLSSTCGATVNCGDSCEGENALCSNNVCTCNENECNALQCGTSHADGCGSTLDCGGCNDGSSCSSAGVCVCTPFNCEELGNPCGAIIEPACGTSILCEVCASSEECYAEACCDPQTCDTLGWECGEVPTDLRCGLEDASCSCGTDSSCVNNQCVCDNPCGTIDGLDECGVRRNACGEVSCPPCEEDFQCDTLGDNVCVPEDDCCTCPGALVWDGTACTPPTPQPQPNCGDAAWRGQRGGFDRDVAWTFGINEKTQCQLQQGFKVTDCDANLVGVCGSILEFTSVETDGAGDGMVVDMQAVDDDVKMGVFLRGNSFVDTDNEINHNYIFVLLDAESQQARIGYRSMYLTPSSFNLWYSVTNIGGLAIEKGSWYRLVAQRVNTFWASANLELCSVRMSFQKLDGPNGHPIGVLSTVKINYWCDNINYVASSGTMGLIADGNANFLNVGIISESAVGFQIFMPFCPTNDIVATHFASLLGLSAEEIKNMDVNCEDGLTRKRQIATGGAAAITVGFTIQTVNTPSAVVAARLETLLVTGKAGVGFNSAAGFSTAAPVIVEPPGVIAPATTVTSGALGGGGGAAGQGAGMSNGAIAGTVVGVSVAFLAALGVGAALFSGSGQATPLYEDNEMKANPGEDEGGASNVSNKNKGVPVMNPESHVRRVEAEEMTSITQRT